MTQRPGSDDPALPTGKERGRTGLVTGSGHGIGRAIADRLLADGWIVYGLDIADQTPRERFRPIRADIADAGAIDAALRRIADEAGRLHGLVSNAGIMVRTPLADLALQDWNRVLATNLTSLFLLARGAQPLLRRSGPGAAIVSIASTRAHMSEPDTESYAASKGGLVALVHALAISLGPDIRVNCISPGWIDVVGDALSSADHAQHPAGRVGRPQDVASMAAWLLGQESGFVTGAEFVCDGGMTRKMIYAD